MDYHSIYTGIEKTGYILSYPEITFHFLSGLINYYTWSACPWQGLLSQTLLPLYPILYFKA